MIINRCLLILLFITIESPLICSSSCQIKKLISNKTQFSCERVSPSQIITGEKILEDQTTDITQITITGWYRLFGRNQQNYLLMQVLHSPNNNFIQISYNPSEETINSQILLSPQIPIVLTGQFKNLLHENWFFLKAGIRLDEVNVLSLNTYIYFSIYTIYSWWSASQIYSVEKHASNNILKFDNNQFQVFYGQSANFPLSSACAQSSQVTVFIGKANHSSQGPAAETSPQEMYLEASLKLQVNFAVLSNIPNIQFNTAKSNRQHVKILKKIPSTSSQNYEILQHNEKLTTGQFNFEEKNGIICQTDLQIKGDIVNASPVFLEIFSPSYSLFPYRTIYTISIYQQGADYQIQDQFLGVNSPYYIVQLDTWYRFTIILTKIYDFVIKKVYLNDLLIFNNKYSYQLLQQINVSITNLTIDPTNSSLISNRKILVNLNKFELFNRTIKVYIGTFYETCSNCSMQMDITNSSDCLMCTSSLEFIQQGKDYSCENSCMNLQYSSSSASWQACEWAITPQTCPIGQLQQFQSTCDCADGQFFNGLDCQACPEYCITCSSATQCKEFYAPRGNNGKCNQGVFDDGRKCIDQYMKIKNRQNDQFTFKFATINCATPAISSINDLIIKNKAFQIGNGSDSFFISFDFILTLDLTYGKTYTLIYMEDEGTQIFTLLIFIETYNLKQSISLCLQFGPIQMFYAPIQNNTKIWIGIYTNLDEISLILKYDNSPISYYSSKVIYKPKAILTDPSLIIGKISPVFPSSSIFCGNFYNDNNWILEGHSSMQKFQKVLQMQSEYDMQKIIDFNFSDYKIEQFTTTSIVYNNINPSQYVALQSPNLKFSNLYGIQIDTTQTCSILHAGALTSNPFAIQLVIYPQIQFPYDTIFLSVVYPGIHLITFKLIQSSFDQFPKLEICIIFYCQYLQYARFQYYRPNYFFVKIALISYSDSVKSVQFSVILNYKSEEIEMFLDLSPYFLPEQWYFILGQPIDTLYTSIYTINNFQLYQGGFYYVDFDTNDPCFLYLNRSNMECILPKEGFALNGDQLIPKDQCNQGRKLGQTIFFYNPFTTKCQDSEIYIPFCDEISYVNLNICIRCIDPQMNPLNNCSCLDGTYFDSTQLKSCSSHCKTCIGSSDYCLICTSKEQLAPSCECLSPNQYQDSNFQCQDCNRQCSQCSGSPDSCTVCSDGRIDPPLCYCDPRYYLNKITDQIQNDCQPIICKNKCLKCEYREENCILCKGDRINPPQCTCDQGYYDHPIEEKYTCSQCDTQFYYDSQHQACRECHDVCSSCYGPTDQTCLGCKYNLILSNGECLCQQGSERVTEDDNSNQCYSYINVVYHLLSENNEYKIYVEFENNIDLLNEIISPNEINNIFSFTISEVPQEYYEIKDYQIPRDNQLILEIGIKKSLQASYGQVHFKQTSIFKNKEYQVVLDPIYKIRTFQFPIGPYFIVLDNGKQKVINAIKQMTPQNQNLIKFIRNLQFLFYLLNSIQPTAMFLLIKVNIPINFYAFLSLFGTFVYKDMPEYQVNDYSYGFTLGLQNVDQYIKTTGNVQFDRLGFRDSFLVNCEIIFYKYVVILALIIIFRTLKCIYLPVKDRVAKIQKILGFLIARISQENEVNLLIIVISLSIQIKNAQESNWLSRWSIYSAVFIGSIFFITNILFFKYYNSSYFKQNQQIFGLFSLRLKQDKAKISSLIKNYHFIYLFKKILIVFFIFFLVDHPLYLCCICGMLNFITAILTFYLKPYKYLLQTFIKAFGDILLTLTWAFMVLFYLFNQSIRGQSVLDDKEVEQFLNQGFIASVFLILFNLLFLINFIFESIILQIYLACQKKKEKKQFVYQKKSIQQLLFAKQQLAQEKQIEQTDFSYKICDIFIELEESNNNNKILLK